MVDSIHSVPPGGSVHRTDVDAAPQLTLSREQFARYRREATEHARAMYRDGKQAELYEQAVPSYVHGNPLLRGLFWERMWRVVKYVDAVHQKPGRVLDFGCGVGVLLPLLSRCGFSIAAVDVDVEATPKYLARFNVEPWFLDKPERLDTLPDASFSVITALDVLEHVPDLNEQLERLHRLLMPGGSLVICGPTENLIYKLGRKIAGFTGHYHVRNIYDIERAAKELFAIERVSTLVPPVPLFQIFSCIRRSS
jgi:2-polyprenyl-3-methyl-5-hydroxy-6-metoxy-1,4-benzoquinol methylase